MNHNAGFSVRLRKFQFGLLLFILTVLAYGLLVKSMGFFADDWYIIWFYKTFGPFEFTQYFAFDRPFLAWIYIIFTNIFRDIPLAWQIFAVFTRFLTALAFWYVLSKVWPGNILINRWAAVLFLVFPGFSEQWLSIMYSHVFLLLAADLLSIGLMLYAMRKPRHWLAAILCGWLLATYALFAVEYFLGLEVLRLLVILIVLRNEGKWTKTDFVQAFKFWAPFGFSTALFLIWRVFIWESYMYSIQPLGQLVGGSLTGFVNFAHSIVLNLLDILVVSWSNLISLVQLPPLTAAVILMWGVICGGVFITWLFRKTLLPAQAGVQDTAHHERDYLQAIALGLLLIIGSMVPFRAAGLEISLTPPFDRFMIIFSLGSVLCSVGLLGYLVNQPGRRFVLLIILIGLSLGMQFKFANTYRRMWNTQKDFLWQLAWRVPGMDRGTILMTDKMPFGFYFSDMSLSAPLNLIYEQPVINRQMAYQFIFTDLSMRSILTNQDTDQPIDLEQRSFGFAGNKTKVIGFKFFNEACLQILDPSLETSWQLVQSGTNEDLVSISLLSRPGLIQTDNASPDLPARYFGPEPAHGWCYYYQKADLSRQKGDWETILRLLREAGAEGFAPTREYEWYPFILAFMNTGKWQEIDAVLPSLFAGHNSRDDLVCKMWADLAEASSPAIEGDPGYQSIHQQLNCNP